METGGLLYGVGLGPGDPELVTVKALRVLCGCDMLILPERDKAACRAWQIAAAACPELVEKEALCLPFPMTRDQTARDAVLEENWTQIKALLLAGKDLAFLTIGDPGVYSTYSYMALRAQRDGCRTAVIPGVASFTACAASLGLSLVLEDTPLHLIPGDCTPEQALSLPGTKVFMKLGKRMGTLKAALLPLEEAELVAVEAVSDCGPGERLYRGAAALPDEAPYMTTVIVRDRRA